MLPVVKRSRIRWLKAPVKQIGKTERSDDVGRLVKTVYPRLIIAVAINAASSECTGPRWVRKAASGFRIDMASMSRLMLDTNSRSWRFMSNCRALPRMKLRSACESASIRVSPACRYFVELC